MSHNYFTNFRKFTRGNFFRRSKQRKLQTENIWSTDAELDGIDKFRLLVRSNFLLP